MSYNYESVIKLACQRTPNDMLIIKPNILKGDLIFFTLLNFKSKKIMCILGTTFY